MPHNPNALYTKAEQVGAESASWTGQSTFREFPNTGTGALTGYLPQAMGILIGRAVGLGPWRTLELARLLNAAFGIAVCALALSWCRSGKVIMFAVLLMPMSLSLFASCGQDATLIALTCLAFATISKQLDACRPLSRVQATLVIVALLVVAVSRPPYLALLPVLLFPGLFEQWRNRPSWIRGFCFACLTFVITVTWWVTAMHTARAVATPMAGIGPVDAKLQLVNLLHHPGMLGNLLSYAFQHRTEYIAQFIGCLGWLDTVMPGIYYLAMILVFAVAVLAEMSHGRRPAKSVTVLSIAACCAGVAAVLLVEYLIWTPVGAAAIYGVQGRYFIPLVIAVAVGLPRLGNSLKDQEVLTAIVVAAQLITVAVLPHVIMARYYTG